MCSARSNAFETSKKQHPQMTMGYEIWNSLLQQKCTLVNTMASLDCLWFQGKERC